MPRLLLADPVDELPTLSARLKLVVDVVISVASPDELFYNDKLIFIIVSIYESWTIEMVRVNRVCVAKEKRYINFVWAGCTRKLLKLKS